MRKKKIDEWDFRDYLSKKEFRISGLCQVCQDKTFSYKEEVFTVKPEEKPKRIERYIAKDNEFVTDDYQMFSGQGEAVSHKYNKYVGKSGNTWLVAHCEYAAENVYVTNNPQNTTSKSQGFEGFGGSTLKMPLVNGEIFELHGGWHTNSDALFDDTGIDVRNTYRTFVVLAKERFSLNDSTYRTGLRGIIYKDEKPTLGTYDRYKDLIKQYPEAKYYYMSSRGGSSCGPV
ncbi:MAG: hypothetical protein Q7R95_07335 [bacterium]|nr:hypothetical protein [bacterium]